MKKIFYSIIAAAAILTGCNHELIVQEGTGSLALDLDCKMDYSDVETRASKTDDEIINALSCCHCLLGYPCRIFITDHRIESGHHSET